MVVPADVERLAAKRLDVSPPKGGNMAGQRRHDLKENLAALREEVAAIRYDPPECFAEEDADGEEDEDGEDEEEDEEGEEEDY